jgi:short subunit dehydrogenase-like uncharacterized protein
MAVEIVVFGATGYTGDLTPFARWGAPAVEAALARGAHYIDSTGEGTFIRRVFEEWGPRAAAGSSALVTAFGYDWVPGNLAGALALRDAGPEASRVEIAYFLTGVTRPDLSSGTRSSMVGVMIEPTFTWRGGRIVTERSAARVRRFNLPGRRVAGFSLGTSEAFGAGRAMQELTRRAVDGSNGGPDAATRARSGSLVLASVYDARGSVLSEVRLEGCNVYAFTAEMLAWGAMTAAGGGLQGTGALGPVDAFGLEALQAGAAEAGIAVAASLHGSPDAR